MMIFLMSVICSLAATTTPMADAVIRNGDCAMLVVQGAYFPASPEVVATMLAAQEGAQSITTVIQDPMYPGEPWTVTTFRREGESVPGMLRRHFDLVLGVRNALVGKVPDK